jgi:hypothetical protein
MKLYMRPLLPFFFKEDHGHFLDTIPPFQPRRGREVAIDQDKPDPGSPRVHYFGIISILFLCTSTQIFYLSISQYSHDVEQHESALVFATE